MATVLYEYFHLTDVWFKTGIIPNINTRIEVDNAGYNTIGDGYYKELLGSHNTDWDNSAFVIKLDRNSTKWAVRVGNRDNLNCGQLTLGNRYSISLDKDYFTFDGTQYGVGATSFNTSNCDIWIGTVNNGGSNFRNGDVFVGEIRIYQNNVLVGEFIPCINNGEYCFYDNVTGTYHEKFGSGTVEAVNPLHTFTSDVSELHFANTGGAAIITVNAETDWSCTKPSWIGMSQTTGTTGETQITIYVPKAFTSRSAVLTFVDSDEYEFTISIEQKGDETIIPICRVKKEGECVNKLFHNGSVVKKLYHGDDLLFRALGGKPYLILSTNNISLNVTGETQTVTVASSNPYTATTTSDWVTLEQNGQTLSITAPAAQSDRDGIVTVSTTNGYFSINKTISVSQKYIEFVDYVYTSSDAYVDTTIRPTVNTKFRVKFKTTGTNGGQMIGYSPFGTPITCESDDTDYRLFNHRGLNDFTFDFNSSRFYGYGTTDANGMFDLTCGNNYIYDNVTKTTAGTGSTQSSIATQRNVPIYINLDNTYAQIQQVTIYDNDVVVFDGHAADFEGDYGIYDTVSETLLKPTNGATVYKGTWS